MLERLFLNNIPALQATETLAAPILKLPLSFFFRGGSVPNAACVVWSWFVNKGGSLGMEVGRASK